ncbi:LysR family transcriptional regulator [Amphibacillus cookii]|uniref:LysR family transcriptional regulator n=1 Tax=Amphibacillus cookii TaxID=767787 RepID=UPI00195DDDE2|nr:LysR family transcriptional regulator [Amphibacillus cookii]MBM7542230.1 DNA-binding transcriptional LysR family regulator [Amphibacillus cookii]
MTLLQLKYAIEVAKHQSISKAAQNLYISQPSLSNAIRELETELGIEIFLRTSKGIVETIEGSEFLGYARQVIEQTELLENRYLNQTQEPQHHFSVTAQHYAFAISAFVNLLKNEALDEYDFVLRETRTVEIIEDVKALRSELGILYLNDFNRKVIHKFLTEGHLIFQTLFNAKPHVFISSIHPLAEQRYVTLDNLTPYPYLSFEQGDHNSFYFSEEILNTITRPKNIRVSDRATLFNLLIGLNGYTISTGIISYDINNDDVIAIPLQVDESIEVGFIKRKDVIMSPLATRYIDYLRDIISEELGAV